jgi:hypothetical protein
MNRSNSRYDSSSVATLLEALPYIREFHGRTIVIKYGGAAMLDEDLREAFASDVVLLKYVGLNPVIVHGGGPEITRYMEKLDLEVRFHEGLRVSDAETVEVAQMVLAGKRKSSSGSTATASPRSASPARTGTSSRSRPLPTPSRLASSARSIEWMSTSSTTSPPTTSR